MNNKQAIKIAIRRWKAHMKIREQGNDRYYSDSNGRKADLKHLAELHRQLEAA